MTRLPPYALSTYREPRPPHPRPLPTPSTAYPTQNCYSYPPPTHRATSESLYRAATTAHTSPRRSSPASYSARGNLRYSGLGESTSSCPGRSLFVGRTWGPAGAHIGSRGDRTARGIYRGRLKIALEAANGVEEFCCEHHSIGGDVDEGTSERGTDAQVEQIDDAPNCVWPGVRKWNWRAC